MKRRMLVLAAFALLLSALAPAAASARQARVSECRGLRGLILPMCVVYCDALHCDSRGDRRICEPLRRLYVRASRGVVPPCEAEPAVCGDGLVNQDGEECDDGNNLDCDGCSFDCREEFCGDGTVCGVEQCEPGSECGSGSCNGDCTCPAPPPGVPCGETIAPECGGECPPRFACRDSAGVCACLSVGE